jgi:hypothetical protein
MTEAELRALAERAAETDETGVVFAEQRIARALLAVLDKPEEYVPLHMGAWREGYNAGLAAAKAAACAAASGGKK